MPNTKSAEKAYRQSARRHSLNLKRKMALKGALKEFKKLTAEKKKDDAQKALAKLYKAADKTAKSNYIHKNKASRMKSRASKIFEKSFK